MELEDKQLITIIQQVPFIERYCFQDEGKTLRSKAYEQTQKIPVIFILHDLNYVCFTRITRTRVFERT